MVKKRLLETMTWKQIVETRIVPESELETPKFKNWLLSKEYLKGYFFNPMFYRRLFGIYKLVNEEDKDHFIVISGSEGDGKTTLGIQAGSVLNPDFSLDQVLYNPETLLDQIEQAEKGCVIVLDEGNLFLFSRQSNTQNNIDMIKLFALMRQKNMIVIICVPNFFTIDSYVRDHRVGSLIQITSRGKFKCYVGDGLRIISKEGLKYKNVSMVKLPKKYFFSGWFNKYFPSNISEEDYRRFKADNFKQFLAELRLSNKSNNPDSLMVSVTQAMKIIPITRKTIVKLMHKNVLKGRKVGGKWFVERKSLEKMANTG